MKLNYSAQICRTYKGSSKCPLSNICKKPIKLSKEIVEEWIKDMEFRAKDLLGEGDVTSEKG